MLYDNLNRLNHSLDQRGHRLNILLVLDVVLLITSIVFSILD